MFFSLPICILTSEREKVKKKKKMKFLGCAVQLLWLIFIVPDFVASAMLPPYNFALLSHSARRVRNPLLRSKLTLLSSVESVVK